MSHSTLQCTVRAREQLEHSRGTSCEKKVRHEVYHTKDPKEQCQNQQGRLNVRNDSVARSLRALILKSFCKAWRSVHSDRKMGYVGTRLKKKTPAQKKLRMPALPVDLYDTKSNTDIYTSESQCYL
jgi:hypothetical protein